MKSDQEEKKDPAKVMAKYSKNSGTPGQPVYSDLPYLYYNLVKKYDQSAIAHIDARKNNKNPPRFKTKDRNIEGSAKAEF